MLRNAHRNTNKSLFKWPCQGNAKHFSTASLGTSLCAKNAQTNRQAKVINKLFGERLAGSKKRWYPSLNTTHSSNAAIFNVSQFGNTSKSGNIGGKNTTRRMAVLNKLFMKHITDLLATGEASELLLGRGLQVTRVKITPDFAFINVFWLGSGDTAADALLERELYQCSGPLRHELSQLMLMSQVPRVNFTREKKYTDIAQVEALLANMDFGKEDDDEMEQTFVPTDAKNIKIPEYSAQSNDTVVQMLRREFYSGSLPEPIEITNVSASDENSEIKQFPAMRQDVMGLDHQHIMSKILSKMRKSKQAWEQHSQQLSDASLNNIATATVPETLESVNKKLAQAAENAEKFERFLAKRRERRNTPERKKYDRTAEWDGESATHAAIDPSTEAVLTPIQRRLLESEDYLHEENDHFERKY